VTMRGWPRRRKLKKYSNVSVFYDTLVAFLFSRRMAEKQKHDCTTTVRLLFVAETREPRLGARLMWRHHNPSNADEIAHFFDA